MTQRFMLEDRDGQSGAFVVGCAQAARPENVLQMRR